MTRMFTQDRTGRRYPFPPKETTMIELHKRRAALYADLEAKHVLDWPLTSRGQDAVFILARKTLNDAEEYLHDGQEDAAALSMQVTEDCLRLLTSMHALATADL